MSSSTMGAYSTVGSAKPVTERERVEAYAGDERSW